MGKTIDDISRQIDSRISDVDNMLKLIMLELVSREADNAILNKFELQENKRVANPADGKKVLDKSIYDNSAVNDPIINTVIKNLRDKNVNVKVLYPLKLGRKQLVIIEFNSKVTAAMASIVISEFDKNELKYKPIIVSDNFSLNTIKALKSKNISYLDLQK